MIDMWLYILEEDSSIEEKKIVDIPVEETRFYYGRECRNPVGSSKTAIMIDVTNDDLINRVRNAIEGELGSTYVRIMRSRKPVTNTLHVSVIHW